MKIKKNLLIISYVAFHNKIGQAGHKTINYYTSKFVNDFNVTVLSFVDTLNEDFTFMVKDHPSVKFIGNKRKKNIFEKIIDHTLFKYIYPKLKLVNPVYYISNGFQRRRLKRLLETIDNLDQFDFVLVEFTAMILQIDLLKKYLPNAKYIASCHDVSFISVHRWIKANSVLIDKKKYYQKFKFIELSALNKFDLIAVHNENDLENIKKENAIDINNLHTIQPYFDTYSVNIDSPDGIVFFGALSRKENTDSIIWFLKNVWQEISETHIRDLKFYIVGGGVSDEFRKYCESFKNIIITGFVPDPTSYFNKSYAMVVPLLYGAGIKVKSIEALATGLPLICNQIGIEGIPAINGKDYIHCETPVEWIKALQNIVSDQNIRNNISMNGKIFTQNYFDLEKSYLKYKKRIHSI